MAFPIPDDGEGGRCPLCGAKLPHVIGAAGCPRTDQLVPGLPPLQDPEPQNAKESNPSELDDAGDADSLQ
ncbi:MAG: hypothetical protein KF841_03485 [Phycisphaerae bacterium]|nr:hypothetical protein [Phycisphaerae bacterium]